MAGEILYRAYLHIKKPVYTPSGLKELIWELSPGAEGEMHGIRYKINSLGLRDVEYSLKKPDGVFRIGVVGDSVVFGYGVADIKDVFPALNVAIITPAATIGITTFLFSFAGVYIGKRVGHLFESKIELAGGLILIGIGIKILAEHLA